MSQPITAQLQQWERAALEKLCRDRTQAVNIGGSHVLCRVLSDYMFVVDAEDCSVVSHLILNGFWEMWLTKAVARFVKPGMRCVDIGANAGYYTVLLEDLAGPTGHVQAWEPQAKLVTCLRDTLRLNGFFATEVLAVCASSAKGIAALTVPQGYWGGATLLPFSHPAWNGKQDPFMVETDTLDAHFSGPVDFMKIDAEGHEPEIWAGAAMTIRQSPRLTVLLEYNADRYPEHGAPFLAQIRAAGFKLARVDFHGNVLPMTERDVLAVQAYEMLWLTH